MSTKSFIFLFIAGISILSLAFLAGRWTAPEPRFENTNQVQHIPGDTSKVSKADASILVYKPKKTELRKDSVVIANFDSTYQDSIGNTIISKNTPKYNLNSDTWEFTETIEVKGFETTIRDTVLISEIKYQIKEIPVKVDQPFYDTFEFGAITVIIIEVLTIGVFLWAK